MLTSILYTQPYTGAQVYVYLLPPTTNQFEGKREREKWLVIRLMQMSCYPSKCSGLAKVPRS